MKQKIVCPGCKSKNTVMNGHNIYGRQVIYCKDCKRGYTIHPEDLNCEYDIHKSGEM